MKHGNFLSPFLLNLFINATESDLLENDNYPLKLVSSEVKCLMFADDLLILSEYKQGLQNSLYILEVYCDNRQLTLNVNKTNTVTMILQNKNIKLEQSLI